MNTERNPEIYNLYHGISEELIKQAIKSEKKRLRREYGNSYRSGEGYFACCALLFPLALFSTLSFGLLCWMWEDAHSEIGFGTEAIDLTNGSLIGLGAIGMFGQIRQNAKDIKFKQCCNNIGKAFGDFLFVVILGAFGTLSLLNSKHCSKDESKEISDEDCQVEIAKLIYGGILYLMAGYFVYAATQNIRDCNKYSAEKNNGVLYVQSKKRISMDEVFYELDSRLAKKKKENVAIAKIDLGGSLLEVQKYRSGEINYIVEKDRVSITNEIAIKRRSNVKAEILMYADGRIKFDNEKYEKKFNQHKLSIVDERKYIGGKKLVTALSQGRWKDVESPLTAVDHPFAVGQDVESGITIA